MSGHTPAEVTVRYACCADDLTSAWAFVMEHLDKVGPSPSIEIKPIWTFSALPGTDDESKQSFDVGVSGTITEGEHHEAQ